MDNTAKLKNRPTHTIFQVIGDGEKSRWTKIGAGWTNKDGKGLFLKFDAYPVIGHISVREITEADASTENGGQQ